MKRTDPRRPAREPHSTDALVAVVYEELRRLAYHAMAREPERPTLQPTALVHEAYLRLCAEGAHGWANRAQFFRAAATAMRRILVERARRRCTLRHGAESLTLDAGFEPSPDAPAPELLELDAALEQLESVDPELFALVELRYFAGLTIEEAALVLGTSPRTVRRDWATARLFLYERMHAARGGEAARAT